MKNLIILGLTSLLLFSVSAGLSLWLKQSKEDAAKTAEAKKDEGKKEKDEAKKESEKKDDHAKDDHAKPAEKGHDSHASEAGDPLGKEKDKLLRRQEQIEIVLQDVREQQEKQADLAKKFAAEAKTVKDRNAELESKTSSLEKEKTTLEKAVDDAKKVTATVADAKKAAAEAAANEAKNLDKIAGVVEAMPADKAALQIQEMANGGRLETAVKILGKLKDRQAAKIISEIADAGLVSQLLDKMVSARKPAAAPATTTTPAPTAPPASTQAQAPGH